MHIINLKQGLNPRLKLKKVHRTTKFNSIQAWLKACIHINRKQNKTKQTNKWKIWFQTIDGKCRFWKNYENVRKHTDIKLLPNKIRRNHLVLERSYKRFF